jgi:hypothetical protein
MGVFTRRCLRVACRMVIETVLVRDGRVMCCVRIPYALVVLC